MRLLASTIASLRPANVRCRRPTRTCPSGAETQKPYRAILNARESTFIKASALLRLLADFLVWEGTPARWEARISWTKDRIPMRMRVCYSVLRAVCRKMWRGFDLL